MLAEIREAHARGGWVLVIISENQRDDRDEPLGGGEPLYVDPHGHAYYETAGVALVRLANERLALRTRYERPGSLQRTSVLALSNVDLDEAEGVGAEAVQLALAGRSDLMVAIQRPGDPPYRPEMTSIPLEMVAHQEQRLPDAFISPNGIDVTAEFVAYARPLIGGPLPRSHRLGL